MTLEKRIKNLIKTSGAITIAQFMQNVLFDPEHGYYQKQEPFGEGGDFITAPEISQAFGEIIGSYAAYKWINSDKPKKFNIIELGPGNGTLLDDFLRATAHIPAFHSSLTIYLVEISVRLRKIQIERLEKYGIEIIHVDNFTEIKEGQSFIYANEFFDALPINQYYYDGKNWGERLVSLDTQDNLQFIANPSSSLGDEVRKLNSTILKEGMVYEISPHSNQIMDEISKFSENTNSSAVFIDYGYVALEFKDTLQALKHHKFHDVLTELGTADLTAHVNFYNLAKIIQKYKKLTYQITTQQDFLMTCGIDKRVEILKKEASEENKKKLDEALLRLTSRDQMGDLFKVLVLN